MTDYMKRVQHAMSGEALLACIGLLAIFAIAIVICSNDTLLADKTLAEKSFQSASSQVQTPQAVRQPVTKLATKTIAANPITLTGMQLTAPRIIILKQKGTLDLYDGARLIKTYKVIVGKVSGQKKVQGDKKTPEGEFYVCVLNKQSQYYRALGLSYPTPADAKRGLKQGLISSKTAEQIRTAHRLKRQPVWRSRLGGSIMIHGVAKGRVDTSGCIAMLNNKDMQELFDAIPLGVVVTIKP